MAVGCSGEAIEPVVEPCPRPDGLVPLEDLDFLAHAGGSPQGLLPVDIYTNSREAFEASYENGFRAFELDLLYLADGTVVAAHDGYEDVYGLDIPFGEATRDDVIGRRYRGEGGMYPLLLGEDVIDLMAAYPDVWVILDSKWEHTEIARTLVELAGDDGIADRMVPHLASREHVRELEDVYPFPEMMIAIYRWPLSDTAIVSAAEDIGVDNVMMWWDRRWSEGTQAILDDAGLNTWVHTPDDPAVIGDFLDRGVRLYSDGYIECEW